MASSDNDGYFTMSLPSSKPNWAAPISSVPNRAILGVPAGTEDEPVVLEAQEVVPIAGTPAAATPTPQATQASACGLAQDIPVVTDASTLPWDRTTLVLDNGTLSLVCNGEVDHIADDIVDLLGTAWPGAVLLQMDDGSLRGVNLITGASGELGSASVLTDPAFPASAYVTTPGSPWLLIPGNPEMTDWRIIDLKTMESLLLSDEIGGVMPPPMAARSNTIGDTAAVITFPGRPQSSSTAEKPLQRAPSTPVPNLSPLMEASLPSSNAALIIVDSIGNRRWTEASSLPELSASTSHDESLLALAVPDELGMTIRVERLHTGGLVADTGIDYDAGDSFFLLDDEAGLLHLTDDRLDLVTWNGEISTDTLLELDPGDGIPQLSITADSDIVVVSQQTSIGEAQGYLVDTSTGDAVEVPGVLPTQFLAPYAEGVPPRFILSATMAGEDGAETTIQMIDITTGNVVVESAPAAFDPAAVAQRIASLRNHGTIGISLYQPGRGMVLNATSGETFHIEAPTVDDVSEGHEWYFYPSIDGSLITAATTLEPDGRYFIRELTPDAAWVEVPYDGLVTIAAGANSLPAGTPGAQALPESSH